ncbi:MAG: hypothetical protein Q7S87_16445 [Agitococcus sp.]|nr:hypothetical protein [Agitococcus sp.]MDO9176969.1 hypothetical protein [Agitococcus sp.]
MNAILWIFIAIAFGLMMFTNLQEKLPDELSYLKTTPTTQAQGSAPAGWSLTTQGDAIELTTTLESATASGGGALLGILCNKSSLDVRLDPHFVTTGVTTTPVVLSGQSEELWDKGADVSKVKTYNIYPHNPSYFLKQVMANSSTQLQISAATTGVHTYLVDGGMVTKAIQVLSPSCQAQLK